MDKWNKFCSEDKDTWPKEEGEYFVVIDYRGLGLLKAYGRFSFRCKGEKIHFQTYTKETIEEDEIEFWCGPILLPEFSK